MDQVCSNDNKTIVLLVFLRNKKKRKNIVREGAIFSFHQYIYIYYSHVRTSE